MKSRALAGKLLVVGTLVLLGALLLKPTTVAAHGNSHTIPSHKTNTAQHNPVPTNTGSSQNNQTVTPSDDAAQAADTSGVALISPVCYDDSLAIASWQVVNQSTSTTNIMWATQDSDGNNFAGNYHAPAGTSTFQTYYGSASPTMGFTINGSVLTLDMPTEACATDPTPTPTDECIDGSIADNLVVTWFADDTLSIHTKDFALLCDDVTVNLSSYAVPASGLNDDQSAFYSATAVLSAGTDGSQTISAALPDACNDTLIALSYSNDTDANYIASQTYPSTGACAQQPEQPCPPTAPAPPKHHHTQPHAKPCHKPTHGYCPKPKKRCPPTSPCPTTPPELPPVDTPTTPSGSTGDTGGGKGAGPSDTESTNISETHVVTAAAVVATPVTSTATLTDTGINAEMISLFAGALLATATLVASRRTKATSR